MHLVEAALTRRALQGSTAWQVNATADARNATTLLGFTFYPDDPFLLLEYSLLNIFVSSICPLPLVASTTVLAVLLWGLLGGMVVKAITGVIGAWVGLKATRSGCRPCFVRMLGRHRSKWKAIDEALTAQGWSIALLIRVAPVSPYVLSNILLALTSLSEWTYLWTTAVGIIPSELPYAYATVLGASFANEFPPKDPVLLTTTILGLVASLIIACKVCHRRQPYARICGLPLTRRRAPSALGRSARSRSASSAGTGSPRSLAAARMRCLPRVARSCSPRPR